MRTWPTWIFFYLADVDASSVDLETIYKVIVQPTRTLVTPEATGFLDETKMKRANVTRKQGSSSIRSVSRQELIKERALSLSLCRLQGNLRLKKSFGCI